MNRMMLAARFVKMAKVLLSDDVPEAFKKQWKKNTEKGEGKSDKEKEDAKPDFLKKKDAAVATEMVRVAKELLAWVPARKDIDIGKRNQETHQSLTSFILKIFSEMKKEAARSLAKQGFHIDSRGELLKKEWSEYLAFTDPDNNSNKYHYYVVFSFEPEAGSPVFVAMNCSGRIGIIERTYDLTMKSGGGPGLSLGTAKGAAMKHMATKIRKGYEPVTMTRG